MLLYVVERLLTFCGPLADYLTTAVTLQINLVVRGVLAPSKFGYAWRCGITLSDQVEQNSRTTVIQSQTQTTLYLEQIGSVGTQ